MKKTHCIICFRRLSAEDGGDQCGEQRARAAAGDRFAEFCERCNTELRSVAAEGRKADER